MLAAAANGVEPPEPMEMYPADERDMLLSKIEGLERQVFFSREFKKLGGVQSEINAI
jgi:hypothetical protein